MEEAWFSTGGRKPDTSRKEDGAQTLLERGHAPVPYHPSQTSLLQARGVSQGNAVGSREKETGEARWPTGAHADTPIAFRGHAYPDNNWAMFNQNIPAFQHGMALMYGAGSHPLPSPAVSGGHANQMRGVTGAGRGNRVKSRGNLRAGVQLSGAVDASDGGSLAKRLRTADAGDGAPATPEYEPIVSTRDAGAGGPWIRGENQEPKSPRSSSPPHDYSSGPHHLLSQDTIVKPEEALCGRNLHPQHTALRSSTGVDQHAAAPGSSTGIVQHDTALVSSAGVVAGDKGGSHSTMEGTFVVQCLPDVVHQIRQSVYDHVGEGSPCDVSCFPDVSCAFSLSLFRSHFRSVLSRRQ